MVPGIIVRVRLLELGEVVVGDRRVTGVSRYVDDLKDMGLGLNSN